MSTIIEQVISNIEGTSGKQLSELNVVGTHSLVYNSALMTVEGMGYTLTLDNLVNTSGDSPLCFRPLDPRMETEVYLVWKWTRDFLKPSLQPSMTKVYASRIGELSSEAT